MKFADSINKQNKKIDLLIGVDYYHKFFTDEIIGGKEGEPVTQNTFFGWVLSGNISTLIPKILHITSMQINTSPVLNLSNEFENEVFEKESSGISAHHTKIFSNKNDNFIENEEVFTELKKCLAFENNRYCVTLPFKNHSKVLSDNFNVARSRLISLKRKLNSNPNTNIIKLIKIILKRIL